MSPMRPALLTLALTSACVNALDVDPENGLTPASDDAESNDAVIVGDLNWVETTTLPTGSPERVNASKVGYLSIPAKGNRCTAFLVAVDVVMTNEHCVSSQTEANGATVSFRRELGVPWSETQTYACGTFVGDDANLDFALLRCSGQPGALLGTVGLEAVNVSTGAALYVVHQNCDSFTTPGCDPTKKLSPGQVTGVSHDVRHNADTLGGSSGAPVFRASSHQVFALHHVGVGGNSSGRGSYNAAVPMTKILPVIAERFPEIVLGATTPTAPSPLAGDGFEPNDSTALASTTGGSFSADGLTITAADVDVFRLDVTAGARIDARIAFAHAAGDLDMALFVGNTDGGPIARADSATDDEALVVENAAAGTYFLVVLGYSGATNTYDALVTVDGSVTPVEGGGPIAISIPYEGSHAIASPSDIGAFRFSTTTSAALVVRIDFTHAVGDLDLEVRDAQGALVGASNSVADFETVSSTLAAGTYDVRIVGYQGATGGYVLTVE